MLSTKIRQSIEYQDTLMLSHGYGAVDVIWELRQIWGLNMSNLNTENQYAMKKRK